MRIELRIHGRGGQGAVVASLILAKAFHREGYYVQSFPEFGVERRGSPVQAYLRADKEQIHERTKIYRPNQLIILDYSILNFIDVTKDVTSDAIILINTTKEPSEIDLSTRYRVATVDASGIAAKHKIGTTTNPIANTSILGAYVKFSELIGLNSLIEAVKESFSEKKAQDNIAAVEEAYEKVLLPPIRSMGV